MLYFYSSIFSIALIRYKLIRKFQHFQVSSNSFSYTLSEKIQIYCYLCEILLKLKGMFKTYKQYDNGGKEYKLVYESLIGTIYERKCPDLKIGEFLAHR